MFDNVLTTSTAEPLSQNYAPATGWARVAKSIYIWSDTKCTGCPVTADFHKNGFLLLNAGLTKDLRTAFVMCDVNSECVHIQVNSAYPERKRHFTHYSKSLAFSVIPSIPHLPADLFQCHFMHTIFSTEPFATPACMVTDITPVHIHHASDNPSYHHIFTIK